VPDSGYSLLGGCVPQAEALNEGYHVRLARVISGVDVFSFGDVAEEGTAKQRKEYYMGEGGGFPRAQAVVSQVSPRSPMACPNTKRVQNEL
jgi:hypothetical protein